MKHFRPLLPYLLRYRKRLIAGFIYIVVTNLLAVIAPKYIGMAIDGMKGSFGIDDILRPVALYLLLTALSGYFLYLVRQRIIVASRQIEYDLKNDYYQHLQQLPRSFFNGTSTGELISRGTNDLNAIREFLGPGIMYSISTFFRLLFALVAMIAISPTLTLLALLPAPVLSYSVYRIGSSMHKRSKSIQESYAAITNLVQENLSGIRIVRSYNREAFQLERFRQLNIAYYEKNLGLGKLQALFFAFLTATTALSLLPVIWVGGIYVINGTMSIGGIAEFIVYVSMLSWPIISIGWVTSIIQRASSAQIRLNEIFNATVQPKMETGSQTEPDTSSSQSLLSFRNICFHYFGQESHPVLNSISFDINTGSRVAIVGATGSGKSTLVNLIPRLLEPISGSILIDGQAINRIPLPQLREQIGFVPQNNFLFSDTIEQNINWGNKTDDPGVVRNATDIAMLRSDIEDFPETYQTMLGEKGINLSGGQKQRACIARAIAWKPRLLILDDALSAVDTDTEEKIFDALLHQLPESTILLISHRISTVKHCDQIIVLDQGTIAESGTHESLLASHGLYAELYNQQLLEEEIEALV